MDRDVGVGSEEEQRQREGHGGWKEAETQGGKTKKIKEQKKTPQREGQVEKANEPRGPRGWGSRDPSLVHPPLRWGVKAPGLVGMGGHLGTGGRFALDSSGDQPHQGALPQSPRAGVYLGTWPPSLDTGGGSRCACSPSWWWWCAGV